MTNPAILPFDSRAFLLKKETTEGVDAAPTATINAFQLLDGTSKITADSIDRKLDRPWWNAAKKKYSRFRAQIGGNIELVCPLIPGTDKSAHGVALQICGMAETLRAAAVGPPAVTTATIYNSISRNIPSATGWFYHAGELYKAPGMRGNISGLTMEIGKVPVAQVQFEGPCDNTTESALPTGLDYSAFLEPTQGSTESMELLINGFAVMGVSHSTDFGNTIGTREHTEARSTRMSGKASTFKTRFYRTAKADFDPRAKWKAGDIITVKSTTIEANGGGRYWSLITLGQITSVEEADIDNELGFDITCQSVASDAGNDETILEFGKT